NLCRHCGYESLNGIGVKRSESLYGVGLVPRLDGVDGGMTWNSVSAEALLPVASPRGNKRRFG
ncbi:MAG: hypothetical protein KDA81_21535, partial [Planctomycetaceae bacterium]|nr:hypothetical protein [Planctomycetaceae bacterium]